MAAALNDDGKEPLATYTTKARMVVKIHELPFYIPAGTVLESHPGNIEAIFKDAPGWCDGANSVLERFRTRWVTRKEVGKMYPPRKQK